MKSTSYALSQYKKGRLCGASAFNLRMIAYSEAIWGCATRNSVHAIAAIKVLTKDLDQEKASPLSIHLIKAYQVCLQLIKKEKFEMAAELLQALRTSWREAYQQID